MCVCAVEGVGDVLTTQVSLVKLGPKKGNLVVARMYVLSMRVPYMENGHPSEPFTCNMTHVSLICTCFTFYIYRTAESQSTA